MIFLLCRLQIFAIIDTIVSRDIYNNNTAMAEADFRYKITMREMGVAKINQATSLM